MSSPYPIYPRLPRNNSSAVSSLKRCWASWNLRPKWIRNPKGSERIRKDQLVTETSSSAMNSVLYISIFWSCARKNICMILYDPKVQCHPSYLTREEFWRSCWSFTSKSASDLKGSDFKEHHKVRCVTSETHGNFWQLSSLSSPNVVSSRMFQGSKGLLRGTGARRTAHWMCSCSTLLRKLARYVVLDIALYCT